MRVILQEAQRTKQIVQNLFSFARQMPPQRTRATELILRRTIQLRSYDFTSHGVEVLSILTRDCPTWWAMPTSCSSFPQHPQQRL